MTSGKELVGSLWQHRSQDLVVVVKEQFRLGEDIDSWLDCRDANDLSIMMRAHDLVENFRRLEL